MLRILWLLAQSSFAEPRVSTYLFAFGQVTANGGTVQVGNLILPARKLPYHSSHGRRSGELRTPGQESQLLLQVRTRIQVVLTYLRQHDRVRRRVDAAHFEAKTPKEQLFKLTVCRQTDN